MAFGIDASGISIPTFVEVRDERVTAYKGVFGESINTRSDSIFGKFIDTESEREKSIWDEIENTYNSQYPSASGAALDNVLSLTGITRKARTKSTAVGLCTGTPTTVIPVGRIVSVDSTGAFWVTDSEVTIGGGGTIPVNITSQTFGPINALTTDTYTIETEVFGWTSFAVTTNATLGQLDETDSAARIRRTRLLRALGSGTAPALQARLQELDGVTGAFVQENDTDAVSIDGLPAHSLRAIVNGGDDTLIATTILEHKPTGIKTTGDVTVNVPDATSKIHAISFSRPTTVDIFVEAIGTFDPLIYPLDGDAQITASILEFGQTLNVGDDVEFLQILCKAVEDVQGIKSLSVELGFTASTSVQNLTIDSDEISSFEEANIVITMVSI